MLLLGAREEPAHAIVAPFAPVDALLPAARVKVSIDRAVDVASNLVAASEDRIDDATKTTERDTLLLLFCDPESLLLSPQNFNRGTMPIEPPPQPTRSYLNAYADYRSRVSVLERPGAMLVQNGEIDAWRQLTRQERVREDADEVRAALNY